MVTGPLSSSCLVKKTWIDRIIPTTHPASDWSLQTDKRRRLPALLGAMPQMGLGGVETMLIRPRRACNLPLTHWQGTFLFSLCTVERDNFIQHAVYP